MQIVLKIQFSRIYYSFFFYSSFILIYEFCKKVLCFLSNDILSVKVFIHSIRGE